MAKFKPVDYLARILGEECGCTDLASMSKRAQKVGQEICDRDDGRCNAAHCWKLWAEKMAEKKGG